MKIFNTLSQKTEKLNLSQKIGIYVCGVTPYDTTHIGHGFTFIIYDVLVRYLRFLGANVTYVQNITDIDDDILIKAKSLKKSWKNLGEDETTKHIKNMQALNFLKPDFFPKATDHISSMIKIIETLLKKQIAYAKNGSVYFDIKKDSNFGKLSNFSYRAMLEIANERGNNPLDPNKENPLDFVLWQKREKGEPFWDSPWGKGRPGWHIECSAMSTHYLGSTITIHGGGTDLIFPHHEAEIAQSENFTSQQFVKIWMHTAMVYCDGKKMSKSLGNMIFIHDLLKKYSPNAIRLYLLSHNWQTSWNFEEEELTEVQKLTEILEKNSKKGITSKEKVKKTIPGFFKTLENNFNIPQSIKILRDYARSNKPKEAIYICTQILGLRST